MLKLVLRRLELHPSNFIIFGKGRYKDHNFIPRKLSSNLSRSPFALEPFIMRGGFDFPSGGVKHSFRAAHIALRKAVRCTIRDAVGNSQWESACYSGHQLALYGSTIGEIKFYIVIPQVCSMRRAWRVVFWSDNKRRRNLASA